VRPSFRHQVESTIRSIPVMCCSGCSSSASACWSNPPCLPDIWLEAVLCALILLGSKILSSGGDRPGFSGNRLRRQPPCAPQLIPWRWGRRVRLRADRDGLKRRGVIEQPIWRKIPADLGVRWSMVLAPFHHSLTTWCCRAWLAAAQGGERRKSPWTRIEKPDLSPAIVLIFGYGRNRGQIVGRFSRTRACLRPRGCRPRIAREARPWPARRCKLRRLQQTRPCSKHSHCQRLGW